MIKATPLKARKRRRLIDLIYGERSTSHVGHVTDSHVAHVIISHVAHVIDSHVGHVSVPRIAAGAVF